MLSFNNFKNKIKEYCLFISPHLDDAVLSCASTARKLRLAGHKVEVITLFTKDGSPPYSPDALWLLRKCGFNDAKAYFRARKDEDKKILQKLDFDHTYMDFTEALFRKRRCFNNKFLSLLGLFFPSLVFSFPKMSSLLIQNNRRDTALEKFIQESFSKKIRERYKKKQTSIFLPLAIGGHIDHIITRSSLENIPEDIIFWEDFPYCLNEKRMDRFFKKNPGYQLFFQQEAPSWKEEIIRMYKTQFYSLFPKNSVPKHKEKFWIKIK